jgi:hypothetical protein
MTERLIDFPARFAFVNPDGTLTTEARRMMRGWYITIVEPANASEIAAINVFGQRQPSFESSAALEGNGNQILGASAFLPKQPTFHAETALQSNGDAIMGGNVFQRRAPTQQSLIALESNSSVILASQIFGA